MIAQTLPVRPAGLIPGLVLLGVSVVAVAISLTSVGQVLNPWHPNEVVVIALSIGVGVACVIANYRSGARTFNYTATSIVWASITTFVCCPVLDACIERVSEFVEFSGGGSDVEPRMLAIDRAKADRWRGMNFKVYLRDYPIVFNISESDYRSAFGDQDYVRPVNYCVQVDVQSSRGVYRVLAQRGVELDPGSLKRC